MTGLVWVSIIGALLIVALAVGVPYWLTHRNLRPYDRSEGRAYLRAKRRLGRRRAAAPDQSDQEKTVT